MPRIAKGPRLYLRRGRRKPGGALLPDRWFIRDGEVEIGTGCGPDRREGPGGAEEQLAEYILRKTAQPVVENGVDERKRRSDPAQVYLAEVLAEYAAGPALKLADPAKEANFIATVLEWWGEMTVADVRRSTCEAYVAKRMKDPNKSYKKDPAKAPRVSSQTARRELECLSTAIGKWHEEHHLQVVPKVVLPRKTATHRDALTRRQAALLLWAAMGWQRQGDRWVRPSTCARTNRLHMRRFILIALYTGSRSDVVIRARWVETLTDPWADLDARTVYRRGRDEVERRTKRRPLVKIPRRLQAHMERWKRLDEKRGLTSVVHFGGEPITRVKTSFASCVTDAGLDGAISAHWLRHTAATWLMEAGVDIWQASGYLGMSPVTLVKNYGHLRPEYQDEAARAFG